MTPAEGDIIANRFRLLRELGHGAMGSVWLADHLTLEVPCAVKFIVAESVDDPRYRAQFHLEARALAQVQSRHVIRVLDHDFCDHGPYIAMELLVGEHLLSRLERVGRLDARTTCQIVSQVARGLSKVHEAGILHRDLKPENVFLARDPDGDDDDEVVKLYDFGLAGLTAFSLRESIGDLIGTPEYMSPEQAGGVCEIDHRSDLWSLAVIAYRCLTGQLPFEGATLIELLSRITRGPIPIPSEVAPDLSPDFDWWWARAASRNIDGRFQSALRLATALAEALGVAEPDTIKARSLSGALASAPRIQASPERRPEGADVRAGGSPARRSKRWMLVAAFGLIIAPITLMRWGGHSEARTDATSLPAPRSAAMAAPAFDSAAPPLQLVAEPAARSSAGGGAWAADRPVAAARPASVPDRPRRVVPPPRPHSRELARPRDARGGEVEVDFGI
jgi:hypothetical protein